MWKALATVVIQGTPCATVSQIAGTVGPTVQLGEDMVRRRGLCLNYSMDPSYVNLITIPIRWCIVVQIGR